MVWFQCEVCGENLKKPKLPNHFRICSSYKLSCIDCGQVFDKQSVQGHTQCITEAEKYGPKGQTKVGNGTPAKPNKDKPKPDVDINVGLSERPPWFCSLCNTNATSKQALLLHADGKKHRAKSRAYAANQAKPSGESLPTNKDSTENISKNESSDDKKENCPSNEALVQDNSALGNGNGNVTSKKRIADVFKDDSSSKKAKHELGEGDCKNDKCETGKQGSVGRKEDCGQKKIKWKKLITSALKSTPEEALKIKKLQKLILKSLVESGITVDDIEFKTTLEHKVNSSSKFTIDGKHVKLAIKR